MSSINLSNINAVLMSRAYKKHASFHSRHVTYWLITVFVNNEASSPNTFKIPLE
jgi:hypothetical protein